MFCNDGIFFTELKQDYGNLFDEVWLSQNLKAEEHGFMEPDLTKAAQDQVLSSVGEKLGDRYWLLFPESLTTVSAELSGVALCPTGDGFGGFLGVLGKQGDCAAAFSVPGRVYALSFTGKEPGFSRPAPVKLSKEEVTELAQMLPQKDVEVLSTRGMYCRYPDIRGALIVVRDSSLGFTYLLPFARQGDKWVSLPLESDNAEQIPTNSKDNPGTSSSNMGNYFKPAAEIKLHGIVLENTGAEHGYVLRNSNVYVLPDLDGNRADEVLFVTNDVAVFFWIKPAAAGSEEVAFSLREVSGVNFTD